MEDVISGIRLRRPVAFHSSVCVQLPLLLGSVPESYNQYRLGSATSNAPRHSGAVMAALPGSLAVWNKLIRSFSKDECLIDLFADFLGFLLDGHHVDSVHNRAEK